MKIGSTFDTPAVPGDARPGATQRKPGAGAQAASAAAPGEQVELSGAGAAMSGLQGSGEFDSAKVDEIRAAIRDGRFKPNAGAIADRLIAEATALLTPRSH